MTVVVSGTLAIMSPVTTPPAETEAIAGEMVLHVPGVATSLNGVVRPWHTARLPSIAPGSGFTVTIAVVIQPVGKV